MAEDADRIPKLMDGEEEKVLEGGLRGNAIHHHQFLMREGILQNPFTFS
jgi:hypothetical protein